MRQRGNHTKKNWDFLRLRNPSAIGVPAKMFVKSRLAVMFVEVDFGWNWNQNFQIRNQIRTYPQYWSLHFLPSNQLEVYKVWVIKEIIMKKK